MIKENQKIFYRGKETLLSDIPYHSHKIGVYICDFCGSLFERQIRERNYSYENSPFDSCGDKDCATQKRSVTNINKYGAKTIAETEIGKQKMVNTYRERYGVDNPMEVPEFVTKIAETKVRNGTDVFTGGCPRINGIFASWTQINLSKKLDGRVNYRIFGKFADIVLEKDKLIIEYDGSGHTLSIRYGKKTEKEFYENELRYQEKVIKNGWKFIRIINEKDLPLEYDAIVNQIRDFSKDNIDYLEIKIS